MIFLALFTYIFGGAVAGGSQQAYLQFLLPGLLGQTIAMASVSLGQNLNVDIEKGVFDRFRSLPIARSAPLVGAVLADVVRYLILFAVMMTTGLLMGFELTNGVVPALAALALCMGFALCFGWVSVFVGMIARTSGAVQGIMFLIVLPLSFGSNTFVPTATLPGWLQTFVNLNPISHLVGAVRGLMIGGPVADRPGLDAASGWPACSPSSARWRCAPTAAGPDPRPSGSSRDDRAGAVHRPAPAVGVGPDRVARPGAALVDHPAHEGAPGVVRAAQARGGAEQLGGGYRPSFVQGDRGDRDAHGREDRQVVRRAPPCW